MGMASETRFLKRVPVEDTAWRGLVESHADATVFHHPLWSRLISDCYGYMPFVFTLRDKRGAILAGIPVIEINSWITGRRWVSLPFTDYCGPLAKTQDDASALLRLSAAEAVKKRKVYYQIRCSPCEDDRDKRYYLHHLKLNESADDLFKRFRKKSVQYGIKKASKSGVTIKQENQFDSMMVFYSLHLLTRKKLGMPVQPKQYFRKLWEYIIRSGMGFLLMAYSGKRPIAGGVFLNFNQTLIYKYGATDPEHMALYGNHALLWEAVQWGCENNVRVLDWGRTDIDNEGLRRFKQGWNTIETMTAYTYFGKAGTEISGGWKGRAMNTIVRHSPAFVSRIIGELLYKHTG